MANNSRDNVRNYSEMTKEQLISIAEGRDAIIDQLKHDLSVCQKVLENCAYNNECLKDELRRKKSRYD